ncbi:flavodoxin family protein [Adlercreutzia sp. R21]|uniref:flavodoxin family protein n=1 Tax=Adlercreutzia wanghongyangiae TaxID=3111451 RepID=UPI002DBEE782|nr:flavodoxin family protein [Adlercreutzia sp. R21]MEC4184536.1 flavodoxin family protein [Adlercreutzia sp. R21]
MHRVILHGSCRADGRSAALADELFNACIEECPEDGVSIVSVSSTEVGPCIGCDECRAVSEEPIHVFQEGDPLLPQESVVESDALFHHCVIDDDMNEVRKHLDAADELIVVCPVYFASVPAQMKALLDRLQPYYFTDVRTYPKRPATIHVVGAGGDPHGFEPLIGTVRSALSVAGFSVELVLDWVGKIRADGEITADAEEYPLPPVGGFGALEWGDDCEVAEGADGAAFTDFAEEGFVADFDEEDATDNADEDADWDDDRGDTPVPTRRGGLQASRPTADGNPRRGGLQASRPTADGNPRRGGLQASRSAAENAPGESQPKGRAKLSVSQPSRAPKEAADGSKGGRGPRKSHGKGGGPAYGKKNTKKKGNGRGGRR